VGPTPEGLIPQPSIDRLKQVGDWLRANGEAVYGAKPSPYPYEFDWGSVTIRPGRAYLNIVEWPQNGSFTLFGFQSKVHKAYLLEKPGAASKVEQHETAGHPEMKLNLPAQAPDPTVSVFALEVDGMPKAYTGLTQQPDGSVTLNCQFAEMGPGTKIKVGNRGVTAGWLNTSDTLTWDFDLYRAGSYTVIARSAAQRVSGVQDESTWAGGNQIKVTAQGKTVENALKNEGKIADPRNPLFPDIQTSLGEVALQPGKVHLSVEATQISPQSKAGIHLREIVLEPLRQ